MPVLAQAPYHGAGQTGATVGASGLHTTKVDVTSLGVDVVGTVAPRVDLAATVAYVRPSASYLDGWSATGTGTVYPLAGPAAWLGLTAGLSHVRAAYADGMSVVLGASVAGRVEAGGVTLVPQASVAMLSELDGRTDADGTVGLGLALAGDELATGKRAPGQLGPDTCGTVGQKHVAAVDVIAGHGIDARQPLCGHGLDL